MTAHVSLRTPLHKSLGKPFMSIRKADSLRKILRSLDNTPFAKISNLTCCHSQFRMVQVLLRSPSISSCMQPSPNWEIQMASRAQCPGHRVILSAIMFSSRFRCSKTLRDTKSCSKNESDTTRCTCRLADFKSLSCNLFSGSFLLQILQLCCFRCDAGLSSYIDVLLFYSMQFGRNF